MAKFLNLQPEIFGIDITDLSLKIVKLKKKRKRFKLDAVGEVIIEPGIIQDGIIQNQEALINVIKGAVASVKGRKLDTKYIIACLPEEKSFTQVIQMPKMSEEELQQSVPFEAENYIPLTVDKVYLDFQIIHPHDEKAVKDHLDILINVMPRAIVDSYVSCFKKAGLIPAILEVESQALIRALLKDDQEKSSVLFIDLGGTSTTFIIYSGNSVRFTSSLPISSMQLTQAIADSYGVNFDEAETMKIKYGLEEGEEASVAQVIVPIINELSKQIRRYMTFYHDHVSHEYAKTDGTIEKIVLAGGGANLKKLPEFLSKELGIPVELANPLVNIDFNKSTDSNLIPLNKVISFATALGLAIRGASEEEI